MRNCFFVFLYLFCGAKVSANEQRVPKLGNGQPIVYQHDSRFNSLDLRYQIGDEWGKRPVNRDILNKSAVLRRAAHATARVGGATGFYLGNFNGAHIVATNHHVCPSIWSCRGRIRFPLIDNMSFKAKSVIGRFPEIDLAFVEISVSPRDEALLKRVATNFAFSKPIYRGQKLVTIGFGIANNRRRQMVANFDSDCVVFSGKNEFRKMPDPDELNPGRNLVWSFANGCDVSHGDSGSAMVDRRTGEVVGIIWTGRIPKNARVQNSRYLEGLLKNPNEDVWKELSYAVPAGKIREVLIRRVQSKKDSQRVEGIYRAILSSN